VVCFWGGHVPVVLLPVLVLLISACGDRSALNAENTWHGQTARIRTFDPARAADVASAQAVSRVYEGLLQYAYLDRPYRVEPLLAEALPEVSPDGLIYTFQIRRGIHFQDDPCFTASGGRGRELAAEDFIYSIKRLADRKTASSGYWVFRDRIVGLDEFRAASDGAEATDYARPVEGLCAPNPSTLQFRLTRPYPQLAWVLTMPYAMVVPREAVEFYGRELDRHPVGTGPFILESYRPNHHVEFVRNPQWARTGRVERHPASAAPIPLVDRVLLYVIGDPATAWLMFLDGRLEISGVSRDNWNAVFGPGGELAPELNARGVRSVSAPTLDLYYIGFNMDDPVVGSNRLLRQALTCAFNTDEWTRFYNGRVIRPNGPIPPVEGAPGGPGPFPFDLERARRLLAEAGYPDGIDPRTGRRLVLTLDLGQADNPEMRQSTDLFIQFMDRLGVVVEPRYNNWPTFLGRVERRQVQLFRLSWIADYPDAENFLQLFYSPNASPGSNRSNYSNPEYDRLYEAARRLPDGPERTDLYGRMAAVIQEDCPWIFTHHPTAYVLLQPWAQNYEYHDFPYGMEKYYAVSRSPEP
jgi:oligopeptide transport system substrate-binding protein